MGRGRNIDTSAARKKKQKNAELKREQQQKEMSREVQRLREKQKITINYHHNVKQGIRDKFRKENKKLKNEIDSLKKKLVECLKEINMSLIFDHLIEKLILKLIQEIRSAKVLKTIQYVYLLIVFFI